MNGPHDLGGRMGFGAVVPEPEDVIFHAGWEKRALAVTLAAGALGRWTLDESRHARETLHPADYYSSSYYEIWIKALEKLLARHGLVSPEELAGGHMLRPAPADAKPLPAHRVPVVLAKGAAVDRPAATRARFAPGDRVRTRNLQPETHTRLPGYAREKPGVIEAVRGVHVFPDASAHGMGERPEWLYTVAFVGTDLWGPGTDPALTVTIDAWEPYLDPA